MWWWALAVFPVMTIALVLLVRRRRVAVQSFVRTTKTVDVDFRVSDRPARPWVPPPAPRNRAERRQMKRGRVR